MTDPKRPDPKSEWDSLFAELGMEPPAPALPSAPVREALPAPVAAVEAPAEDVSPLRAQQTPEPEEESLPAEPVDNESATLFTSEDEPDSSEAWGFVEESESAVVDEVGEIPAADEAGPEAPPDSEAQPERSGRRRRRRRRRKGGGPEAASAPPAAAGASEQAEVAESDDDDEAAAPPEAFDDDNGDSEPEEKPAVPAALDEEMEAEAADPLPEWNVMSWTELIATLHRPER